MSSEPYVFALDEAAAKFAETVLNETQETREKSLREIRKWLEENKGLNGDARDVAILPFLRGCKFRIEKTKVKLENYLRMRRDVPEWFQNRDPFLEEIKEMSRLGVFIPLRKLDEGRLVVIIRTAAHNPKKHSQDNVIKTGMMILDIAAREFETAQIYGVTAVFDMTGISLAHARELTPSMIKKVVHAWQNYHCRPKQLEFIKAPLYINVVLNVFKQFMSEKLKNRIRVHFGNCNTLHQVVDKRVLPIEYGGDDGDLHEHIERWVGKLEAAREWLLCDEQFKAIPE